MVKYLLLGFLYGIPSERQIEARCADSNAFHWYLGIDLNERVPDHSTISQLRRQKPAFRKVFRRLFEEVVRQCVEKGLVSGQLTVTDSTHVKANASRASEQEIDVPEEAGNHWKRLDAYEEEGLEELKRRTGKRRAKRTKQVKKDKRRSRKKVSRTDPESGCMKRPGKPGGFYYLSHQTADSDHGIITAVTVTPGDVHDSRPYLEQLEYVYQHVVPLKSAAADSAYDFPLAHRALEELGIEFFVVPQPAHDRTKVEWKRDAFTYDDQRDVYLCPNGKELRCKRLYRSGRELFWEYWAEKRDCGSCPFRQKCLNETDKGWCKKTPGQLFQGCCSAAFLQAVGAGVPGGTEAAADLVRGYFCRAEMGTQSDTSPTTRIRGSGGPLPPFCLKPQKNDTMSVLTPMSVFSLA